MIYSSLPLQTRFKFEPSLTRWYNWPLSLSPCRGYPTTICKQLYRWIERSRNWPDDTRPSLALAQALEIEAAKQASRGQTSKVSRVRTYQRDKKTDIISGNVIDSMLEFLQKKMSKSK
ncbi:hypothetical protein NQ315_006081 [Exocentrus adspersus]|uniref:Transposase n=1 Tax=Exocentrus adspersus TaxID=1586481 RepID=A0AAV8VGR2_9CUCU|nr:hypothetical protein NQ315_006081 [Exocentrus adspersus]